MREKKVRGLKPKLNNLRERIEKHTAEFPTHFYNGYWHLHLPVAQDFINSSKIPKNVKRFSIQTLLNRAEHLIFFIVSKKYVEQKDHCQFLSSGLC